MRAARVMSVLVVAAFAAGCAVEGAEMRSSAAVAGHTLHPLVESDGLPYWHPPVAALPDGHPPIPMRALPPGHPPVPGLDMLPEGHPPVCPAMSGAEATPRRPSRPAGYEVVRI
mgnify:CR=1 FL=1